MMIYGKSSQDGTPSIENPVEIKSVVNPTVKVTNEDGLKVQSVTLNNITLNAIPVPSGGNVTIDGQQYIADYVDLERGVMVQRVGKAEITSTSREIIASTNAWATLGLDKVQPFRINTIHLIPESMVICTALPGTGYYEPWNKTYECIGGVGRPDATIDFNIANERLGTTAETTRNDAVEALKNWLKTNPFSFIYALVTPIETPLTTEQITAFKELVTYYPVTNISVNSEQLDGYTVFNYPISMANGWNYVKKQLNDNRDYIYDMDAKAQDIDIQSAEAYVNSEYAVALTELEV